MSIKNRSRKPNSPPAWRLLVFVLLSVSLGAKTLYIRAGRVFDGKEMLEHRLIVIEGDRIVNIVPWDVTIPTTPDLIDASDGTVLPGLIDCHTQSMAAPEPYLDNIEQLGTGKRTAEEMSAFRESRLSLLKSGVTTVMDFGWPLSVCQDMRKALRKGSIVGPELCFSGPLFTAPGGIPVSTSYVGNHDLIDLGAFQTTEPDKARTQVKALAGQGVDFIEFVYDEGSGSHHAPRLGLEVAKAIVDEAHQHGLSVFAQCGSAEEAQAMIRVGVNGVEGCPEARFVGAESLPRLPDSVFRDMAGRGQLLTPIGGQAQTLERAYKSGVRLCLGTGFPASGGPNPGDDVFREMQSWERAGIPRLGVLKASTATAAEKLGREKDLGRVARGFRANLLIYDGSVEDGSLSADRISEVILDGEPVFEKGEPIRALAGRFRESSLSVLGYPFWDPVLSFMAGGSVTDVDFLHSGITVNAAFMGSIRNMWSADLALALPSPIPRTTLNAIAHFDNNDRLFYGLGNDTKIDSAVEYTNVVFKEAVSGLTRIAGPWKLGTALMFDQRRSSAYRDETLPAVTGNHGGNEVQLSLSLIHDARDHQYNPWYGHYVSLTGQLAPAILPGSHSFEKVMFDLRGYVSPVHRHILAGRVLYQQAFGDVPFYFLPEMGGDTLDRGLLGFRFRDRVGLYGQFEYRFPIAGFMSGAAFVDIGQVQSDLSRLSLLAFHPSFGFGPRFNFGSNESVIISIDFGLAPDRYTSSRTLQWNLILHNGQEF